MYEISFYLYYKKLDFNIKINNDIYKKNIWVDSKVGFLLHALFCLCLKRFYQDLGWLSCLRSPTFRHLIFVIRVLQDISASAVVHVVILFIIGTSFSTIECTSCHSYLEPNGFSAPILLVSVHHWWRDSGMDLSSLTRSSSEEKFVFEFVWLIRLLFWPMIVNVFVAFHESEIILFV